MLRRTTTRMSSPPFNQLLTTENEVEENAAQTSDHATALVTSAKLTETDSSPEIESLPNSTAERLETISVIERKKMKNKKKKERKTRKKAAARVAVSSTHCVDSSPEIESPIKLPNSTSERLETISETERKKMKNEKKKERKKRKKAAARVAVSSTHSVDSSPEIESPIKLPNSTSERLETISETERKKMKNKKKKERKKRKKAAARVAVSSTHSMDSSPEIESPIKLPNSTSERLETISETERKKMKNKKKKERKKRKKAAARVACSSTLRIAPTENDASAKSTELGGRSFEKGEGSKAAREKRTSLVLVCRSMMASAFHEGSPVGTLAATDQTADPLNYSQGIHNQPQAIMDVTEERWDDLIGEIPLKIAYPALDGDKLWTITGCDPKNTRWSNHDGGSWTKLLWTCAMECGTQVTAALSPAAGGTLLPATRPELEKGGASSGKRRRGDSDDGGDQVHRHHVWEEKDLHPNNIGNGSLAVYWKNVNAQCVLLDVIQGVQQMENSGLLYDAVDQVLTGHNCPTLRNKYFYSRWTNGRMTILWIQEMVWDLFKTVVRGVVVVARAGDAHVGVEAVKEGAEEVDEEVVVDEELGDVPILWRQITGGLGRIGTVVGIGRMRTRNEFQDAVNNVLTQQELPTNRVIQFVSAWNQTSVTILFRTVPWALLRAAMRCVGVNAGEGDLIEMVAGNLEIIP